MTWRYEPDEQPKRKHHWSYAVAGFERDPAGQLIGKCPAGMTIGDAQGLLDEGVPWSPRSWRKAHPKRLYAVRDGVLYRATPTNPGASYHGFPEHPTGFPDGANDLKSLLLLRARTLGCEAELRRWMNW